MIQVVKTGSINPFATDNNNSLCRANVRAPAHKPAHFHSFWGRRHTTCCGLWGGSHLKGVGPRLSLSQLACCLTLHFFLSWLPIATLRRVQGFTLHLSGIHANMRPALLICIPALSCWHLLCIQQQLCLSRYGAKTNAIPSFGHVLVHERGLSAQFGPLPHQASAPRMGTRIPTSPTPF